MKLPLCLVATAVMAAGGDSMWVERLALWMRGDLQSLDREISAIDATLRTLPELTQINSCVRVGMKTGYTTDEDVRWVEVTLHEPAQVDTVVLVPPLAKAATAVIAGYGFPVRFLLEVVDASGQAYPILDQTAHDLPNPGCFPVVARFPPREVSRVRLTATDPWSSDGPDVLALAELLVLSGNRNLAIDGKVTSSSSRNAPRAWTRANLVDMITPLGLPVAPQAGGTLGFHSALATSPEAVKWITLELPEVVDLDEVRLVPVRRKDVPLWFDYGFPSAYRVECSMESGFRDSTLLAEMKDRLQPTPGMNLVCIPARKAKARFIRITASRLWEGRDQYLFALAEVQVLAHGENVAPRGSFTASDSLEGDGRWSLRALADGLTEAGKLVELPEWFAMLEQRRVLTGERTRLVNQRLSLIEQAQHALVYGSLGSVGGISVLSILLLWRQQRNRRRDARRLQDKLARDLHDEIGSNLGSITLICSMAAQPEATLESLRADLADIERVAEESADSMRDMVQLISPRRHGEGKAWLDVLQTLTERLLRGIELECSLPSAPLVWEPDLETRRELYLFCKEVLHNIVRHARASRVRFILSQTVGGLHLEVADNGAGFDAARPGTGHGLGNLRSRAASMNALLDLHSRPGEGTIIHLDIPRSHRWQSR